MKRNTAALLIILSILSLVLGGCNKKAKAPEAAPAAPAVEAPAEAPAETPTEVPEASDDEFVLASEISEDKKQQAHEVLSTLMSCYEEDNPAGALPLFTSDFGATEENVKDFFSKLHELAESPFIPYDSYYMNNLAVSDEIVKVKNSPDASNYIEITPAQEEMYVALYTSEGSKISYMLTILLIAEDGQFKVAFINPSDYKYSGAAAPEIYAETKALYDEGKLISAYVNSCMLTNTLRPGGYMRYANHTEMEELCYTLFTEVSNTFILPLSLDGTSNSAIYEVGIANDAEHGIIPLFLFKTDVSIGDSSKTKAEAEKVLAALEELSPGISESFDYIRFNVTNDSLDDNATSVKAETVTLKLN